MKREDTSVFKWSLGKKTKMLKRYRRLVRVIVFVTKQLHSSLFVGRFENLILIRKLLFNGTSVFNFSK